MSVTSQNLTKHELIGLTVQIMDSTDESRVGHKGRIVDESKNTFKMEILGKDRIIPKNGTVLGIEVGGKMVQVDASNITYRPEDRIKKVRKRRMA